MSNTVGNFFRSPSFKFMVIGTLSLLLLIPAAMIRSLINEREYRQNEAIEEISQSWSLSQTITGPFLDIPLQSHKDYRKNNDIYLKMPESLDISGTVKTEEKKRGIFAAAVYTSELVLSGSFNLDDEELSRLRAAGAISDKVYICIGISDLREIGNLTSVELNGVIYGIEPGIYSNDVADKGFHIPVSGSLLASSTTLTYNITLELKGSSDLYITPLGRTTDVNLTSPWPDPSFTGKFLPSSKKISAEGFKATWGVNYLNRNYPQSWYDRDYRVDASSFGVKFLFPVDHYQKSERSVKYAFMFIALSFLVFFLTEIILKSKIHPIQYLLVGFALIIFYTLLISLAEQVGFNLAYLISTVAVTLLVGIYMKSSTSSWRVGTISGLLLLALYGFLFTTLQLQELSLLMGSIGLFLILAVIMIVSRKINWYKEEAQSGQ